MFNRRTYPASLILVYFAGSQRCYALNVEPPTILPAMSTRDILAGRWTECQGTSKGDAPWQPH
eukprot:scaffold26581_cov60-Phaeocystis_antarctica.AAC.4